MKLIYSGIIITAIVILGLLFSASALAYSPPDQSSDNATDVIIWHGDSANITLSGNITVSGNATITIPGLQDDMKAAMTTLVNVLAVQALALLERLIELGIVFSIAYFAYRFRDRPLFIASGIALCLYGWSIWHTFRDLSILLFLIGAYQFSKAGWDKDSWGKEKK
jgi:hypothetical protein